MNVFEFEITKTQHLPIQNSYFIMQQNGEQEWLLIQIFVSNKHLFDASIGIYNFWPYIP